tara:strand:+ start:267 stop:713 length:447 start_codon:yes stop_codon:yes gene_type:complete
MEKKMIDLNTKLKLFTKLSALEIIEQYEYISVWSNYYDRPNKNNRLFGRPKKDTSIRLKDISDETKKVIVEYIKNNGVYFFTANDDDEGYAKDDSRFDIEYCEDRCEGFYLDTESKGNIGFEPLDIYTEQDLGHARMYYKENNQIKQL